MRLVIEIGNETDANLLVSLVKRLKGKILKESATATKSKATKSISSITALENLAKRGGISSIENPSEWQREQRKDRKTL